MIERYNLSFAARLVLADPTLQIACGSISDEITDYIGVNMRESWKQRRFNKGRQTIACLLFKGKKLCLALALDPKKLASTKYRVIDASDTRRYSNTPTLIKLTSPRQVKYAKELIAQMMDELQVEHTAEVRVRPESKYLLKRESLEKLVQSGRAKLYNVDASTAEFFEQKKAEMDAEDEVADADSSEQE
jgi:predicted transport protein